MQVNTLRWDAASGWSRPPSSVGGDGPSTAVLIFGSAGLDGVREPIAELLAAYPRSAVVGCSTAGEVIGELLLDDGLTAAICRFDSTSVSVASVAVNDPAESWTAGHQLAQQLVAAEPDLSAVFVLSDGVGVNGSTLAAGLVAGTGNRVPISGGLAGDGQRFEQTWVLADGQPRRGYVCALGLAGPKLQVGHGSYGGWDILGPERRVTRSVGNVLYELDDQPALALYKRYLGDRAAGLPATALLFPLSVRSPRDDGQSVLRTILAVDEQEQSMTFAGDVDEGSLARLMRATLDRLIDGAQIAASQCAASAGSPTLAVAVSCVGRRLVLGRRTEDELIASLSGLPGNTTMIGYYSYGEISPRLSGSCDLLNQTMTITTFQEVG